MSKIGILGGSFDPIHNGHLEIAKIALDKLSLDKVIFIPTFSHPFNKKHVASYHDRLEMIKLAIAEEKNFEVSNIEQELYTGNYVYTYDVLVILHKMYLNAEFYFIIGSDQIEKLEKWYKIDEIVKLAKFVLFSRDNTEKLVTNYPIIEINHHANSISSTKIRNGDFGPIDLKVREYIFNKCLYIEEIVAYYCTKKRYLHVLGVVELALKLASSHDLDLTKVKLAGYLHDIAKDMNKDELLQLMQEHYPIEYIKYPECSWIYHQFIGEYLVKEKLKLTDREILEAIRNHTIPSADIGKLAMIIYIADKKELSRGLDNSKYIEMCKQDLIGTFKLVLEEAIAYEKNKDSTKFKEVYDG